jgi:hypothetical protein
MEAMLLKIIFIIRHEPAVAESVYQSVKLHEFAVLVLPLYDLVLFTSLLMMKAFKPCCRG